MIKMNIQKWTFIYVWLSYMLRLHLSYEYRNSFTKDNRYERKDFDEMANLTDRNPEFGKISSYLMEPVHEKSAETKSVQLMETRYIEKYGPIHSREFQRDENINKLIVFQSHLKGSQGRKKSEAIRLSQAQTLKDGKQLFSEIIKSENYLEKSVVRTNNERKINAKIRKVRSENSSSNFITELENHIKNTTGKTINMFKLLTNYSQICPLTSCDMNHNKVQSSNIFLTKCHSCICDSDCIIYNKCCPDSIYGYLTSECTCANLYPDCSKTIYGFNMVTSCQLTFENVSIINSCNGPESYVSPVLSNATGILYKNAFCALCNEDGSFTYINISVKCPDNISFPYTRFLDADKRLIEEKECIVKYNVTRPTCILGESPKIDKCNVSGLWRKYDADIDWACKNLLSHFLHFKNVFCYICNPSITVSQTEASISSCNVTGLWRQYNTAVEKACIYSSESERLRPYKNIYCAICNGKSYSTSLKFVYETLYSSGLTTLLFFDYMIAFRLSKWDNFTISEKVSEVKQKLEPFLTNVANPFTKYESDFIDIFDQNDFLQLTQDYSRVCGSVNICNKTLVQRSEIDKEENLNVMDGNPVCGKCSCKPDCVNKNNCCFDVLMQHLPYSCFKFNYMDPKARNLPEAEMHESFLQNFPSYYGIEAVMVDKCTNPDTPAWLRQRCEENNDSDIIYNIPFGTTKIAQKNIFCLICNKRQHFDGIFGNIRLGFYCNKFIEPWLYDSATSVSSYFNRNCLKAFLPRTRKCAPSYEADSLKYLNYRYERLNLDITYRSVIETYSHSNLPDKELYDRCNKTQLWLNNSPSIKSVCESKSASVHLLPYYNIRMKRYKNVACFICNPSTDERTTDNMSVISNCKNSTKWYRHYMDQLCTRDEYSPLWFPYKNFHCQNCNLPPLYKIVTIFSEKVDVTYRTIFSLKPEEWRQLIKTEEYNDVDSVCSFGTFELAKNECRSLHCRDGLALTNQTKCAPLTETLSNVTYEIKMLLTLKRTTRDSCSINNFSENFICLNFVTQMNASLAGSADYVNDFCHLIDRNQCSKEKYMTSTDNLYLITHRFSVVMTKTLSLFQSFLMEFLLGTFNILDISTASFCTFNLAFESSRHSNKQCLTEEIHAKALVHIIDRCFMCPHFIIDHDDILAENKSNAVTFNGISVPLKYFSWSRENGCLCLEDFKTAMSQMTKRASRKEISFLTQIHDIYSDTCTITSLLCLLITFLTYCFFKSLRSIAGKNNMLLVLALFFAQASLGLLRLKITSGLYCILTGVALHYFWLAAFFAMSVCSFHMLRTFSHSLSYKIYLSSHTQLRYILYTFCFPLIIVTTTIVSNVVISDRKYFGYGLGKCFLSDTYSFILAFIVPSSVIFVSNMTFYFIALYNINTVRNRMRDNQERENLLICLKLCTIAGITWPLLILDGTMEISWFSFIAVSMNALQGVFILLSFICNTRVLNLYLGCLCIVQIPEVNGSMINERTAHTNVQL